MSWGVRVENVKPEDVYDELEKVAEEYFKTWSESPETEVSAFACATAAELAQDVAINGIVLPTDGEEVRLNVAISGHANPFHKKTQGWANDFVQITVTQA